MAEVLAAWPVVRQKFEAVERVQGQIRNPIVEKTRRKQAENRRKKVEAGRGWKEERRQATGKARLRNRAALERC